MELVDAIKAVGFVWVNSWCFKDFRLVIVSGRRLADSCMCGGRQWWRCGCVWCQTVEGGSTVVSAPDSLWNEESGML